MPYTAPPPLLTHPYYHHPCFPPEIPPNPCHSHPCSPIPLLTLHVHNDINKLVRFRINYIAWSSV